MHVLWRLQTFGQSSVEIRVPLEQQRSEFFKLEQHLGFAILHSQCEARQILLGTESFSFVGRLRLVPS